MNKYIIKNCPACCYYAGVYGCEDNHDKQGRDTYCEKISDCLLKQIVELCKNSIRENERDIYRAGRMSLAVNIVNLLDIDISEVE